MHVAVYLRINLLAGLTLVLNIGAITILYTFIILLHTYRRTFLNVILLKCRNTRIGTLYYNV